MEPTPAGRYYMRFYQCRHAERYDRPVKFGQQEGFHHAVENGGWCTVCLMRMYPRMIVCTHAQPETRPPAP